MFTRSSKEQFAQTFKFVTVPYFAALNIGVASLIGDEVMSGVSIV